MEVDCDESLRAKAKESFFFYSKDNYLQGVLVRLRHVDALNISLKVYFR